jgi:hypothetical protein
MPNKCPLCGQALPAAIEEQALHEKLDKLKSAAVQAAAKAARKELEEEFEARLAKANEGLDVRLKAAKETARAQAAKELGKESENLRKQLAEAGRYAATQVAEARKAATAEAARLMKGQLDGLNKKLADAERKTDTKVAQAKKEAAEAARLMKGQFDDLNRKLTEAERKRASEVAKARKEAAEDAKEKEQLRHTVETSRLQSKVEELSRQLEKKSGEQFGEEGELDLYAELLREFPSDTIQRVGRGVKGADILHTVMDGNKEAGCIVYESKNVSTWQNAFIDQAKKYHTQYETPYVMVVSRVFPKKQRGMCVVDEVPIVEPRLATTLAAVMREGILEIAKLRLTKVGSDGKAQELFTYIVGNEFQTRFREVADAVDGLKELQKAERTWHENTWTKESRLHSQLESRHREINAKLQLIATEGGERRPMAVASGRR